MANNCAICKKKVEETFLGKLKGTIVKIKDGEKNKLVYVCDSCQKEHKGDLMKKVGGK